MAEYIKVVDAHAHLWLHQDTSVNGQPIYQLEPNRSRSMFFGEEVQMLPPYMTDGQNTAERFLSNMDYARVSAAVVTQEFIDGLQNSYLAEVKRRYPDRFFVFGMPELRQPGFAAEADQLIKSGFRGLKIPAARLPIRFINDEMMQMMRLMEANDIILGIELADGDAQVSQMEEIISECPRLRIAIGHFGMVTRPGWMEQIKLARHDNVYIESGGITWLFNDEFYPFPSAVRAIREAADAVGWDKLMWGSDYPRTITAITYKMSFDFVIKSNELTDGEKQQFLSDNARRFFGFDQLKELPYIKNMSE
ncbi:MAG: amidohydrolase [Prevotella sp.]|nr:amidohydrolase [Prevotella sp.]